MAVFILFLAAFFPVFLIIAVLRSRNLMSLSRGIGGVLAALAMVAAASLLQSALSSFGPAVSGISSPFFRAFITASFIEETCKLFGLYLFLRASGGRGRRTDENPWTAALLVSSSFAAFETLAYGLLYPGVELMRLFTALPLHIACGLLASRALSPGKMPCLLCFAAAVSIHGAYSFAAGFGRAALAFQLFLIMLAWLAAFRARRVSASGGLDREIGE
ncbi:PrsW family glutamic-type intramembrane protease [Methanoculleus sp. UBA300]|uniref:PrsW family glutamic-type intramembrane protease n=1 Tax=Methanoculleus sp. UBA300 TaxID=1915496 RepID=UPI00319E167D